MYDIEKIKTELAAHQPRRLAEQHQRRAAVAMLLTETQNSGPEVLFIRRAEFEGDPWSGDVAFPGGGIEPRDAGPQQAAEREVCEEIGLCLQSEQCIGQLDDLAGAYLSVQVSCYIYHLPTKPVFRYNSEVVESFWVPLHQLLNPQRRRQASFSYRGSMHTHPIIDLDGYCERFLWGITYRLFENFFSLVQIDIQATSRNA